MNRNSAVDYIYLFSNLIEGKLYTRTSNVYATDHYLNNIYNEKGYGSLENCLLSLLQHIEYYEDKAGTTLNKQRLIYKKYSDLIEREHTTTIYPNDVDETQTYSEGKVKKVLVNTNDVVVLVLGIASASAAFCRGRFTVSAQNSHSFHHTTVLLL